MDFSSSSDSSDEELFEILENIEVVRNFRVRNDPFVEYSEGEFRDRFWFTKNTVNYLVQLITDDIRPTTHRNRSLSVAEQLLLTLRFYATGSFQILIGDDLNVHKSTVCRVLRRVTYALARLAPQFIKLPDTDEEIRQVKNEFYAIRRVPNVIGCIDGSHIPIQSPGGDNAEIYRNRKSYFSINVQVICDAKLLIRDIDARWPGSTHDSTMFNASLIRARLEAEEFPESYLLGDSAYACTKYLLTPLLHPVLPEEQRYNAAYIATRNTVERTFGVWKRRFACLSLGLRTNIEALSLPIIVATAVLHNIAILRNDLEEFDEELLNIDAEVNDIFAEENGGGNAVRRAVINLFR
ncbi:hypothetical protein NQ314_016698 [Rhamnusium bicolor]|uniref:Putative nuclease HARBI1 n=1 Tax=Rhamnusium bicolor TaxID=1586634 RepID=A0AAV8WWB2_9CUCU|nr:hypothetical protein NQ314_016698 [Rhamnusium bicolor]